MGKWEMGNGEMISPFPHFIISSFREPLQRVRVRGGDLVGKG